MHTDSSLLDLNRAVALVAVLDARSLDRLQAAIDCRRAESRTSGVLERRAHADGVLQLEYRRNPKTGAERGPYWYFKHREAGRQRTEYVGKDLGAWMERREGRAHA
jgi:hypothetical protein